MNPEAARGWLQPKPLPAGVDEATQHARIDECLASESAEDALRALVYRWFAEGLDEGQALQVFLQFRERLEGRGRQRDEDQVGNIIDCLIGWSGAFAVLRRASPTPSAE